MPWLAIEGPMLAALNLDFRAQFLPIPYWNEAFLKIENVSGLLTAQEDV